MCRPPSTNNALATFSNYDDDGATFSAYGEEKLYNLRDHGPRWSIISTYPNGNYRRLNGTSMVTPSWPEPSAACL